MNLPEPTKHSLEGWHGVSERCPWCGREPGLDRTGFDAVRLSVLMPVYNEKDSILEILERVRAIGIPKEIVLVDDGSTDGTRDLLRTLATAEEGREDAAAFDNSLRVIFHEQNQGKGAALRTAIAAARGDVVIIQDADLEYDPKDYYKMLYPILAGKADVVYGSRFLGGGAHRVLYFWHYMGNKFITFLSNMFTNLNLSDIETCYKAFTAETIKAVPIEQDGFGFEVEITSKLARTRCRIYEVGISYFGRTYSEGKKITWKDGLQALYLILKYR